MSIYLQLPKRTNYNLMLYNLISYYNHVFNYVKTLKVLMDFEETYTNQSSVSFDCPNNGVENSADQT